MGLDAVADDAPEDVEPGIEVDLQVRDDHLVQVEAQVLQGPRSAPEHLPARPIQEPQATRGARAEGEDLTAPVPFHVVDPVERVDPHQPALPEEPRGAQPIDRRREGA